MPGPRLPSPQTREHLPATSFAADPRPVIQRDERPWGEFELLSIGIPVAVKILTVSPGARLSLQRHAERDELWVVLDDGLRVEIDGDAETVRIAQKLWIPRGSVHRLENVGRAPARVVEVAFGRFDEADIERLDDDYER